MRLGKLVVVAAALVVALVAGWSSTGEAVDLPACTDIICAINGDFTVMSLPLAGVDVASSPGQISGGVVVYTGSNGAPVTTNFVGMDNAFSSVTGACPPNCSFSTTTAGDPGQIAPFVGDQATTWDSTLAAFLTFLNGESPLFFFNQNDTNNGGSLPTCGAVSQQDVCVYGLITLVDLQNSANNLTFELQGPTTLFSGGETPTDGIANLPADFVLARGAVCLDSAGNQVACDGNQDIGPINHNLGADHAAYVGFADGLNAALATCAVSCPWDSISIRLDLGDVNNGFEQLFILTAETVIVTPVPAPAALMLVGTGLMGVGAAAWRRRQRG